jgi:hypothetical protein
MRPGAGPDRIPDIWRTAPIRSSFRPETNDHRAAATAELPHMPLPRRMRITAPVLALAALLPGSGAAQESLLTLPQTDRPVLVRVGLHLFDIVAVDDGQKTVEFEGILTATWQDDRLRFDPVSEGVREKIYQGDYQFSEISPGWWPQLVLRNESGLYERQGVILRVRTDGQVRYQEEFQAIAEVQMELQRIPFDRQVFELVFEVLGFDAAEVLLEPDADRTSIRSHNDVNQWEFGGVETRAIADSATMQSGRTAGISAVAFRFPAERNPRFLLRNIVLPLLILVGLSWSVFWMDSEQLSDRMGISFLGILTVVAFQIVVSDMLPRIPYFTILSSFLLISYLMLVASVVVNLTVGWLDRKGRAERADRLDRACRWAFPLAFVATNTLMVGYYFLRY